ncbi:TPA: hypothetical protein DDZ86_04770 [Candidatus Dependentiae bacterium]|nr:MAG: hypothetical protein A2Y17_09575 [Clostridiales bacterium GWF2_38_85]HBL98925.1 hypothetical protein [Candidatus Dependentiae bacterium]
MEKADILTILRSKSSVFSFKEILIGSGEKKSQLLRRRLNYYVKQGELYPIRRGLYARDKNYDRFELATKIFTPSYISFETILVEAGVIFQYYGSIFVATYQTKEIECDDQVYSFRKLKDTILLNNAGVENRGHYYAATKERAFLDILYLNNDYYFDNLGSLDLSKIRALLPLYNNKRMVKAVDMYFKETRA